MQKFEYMWVDFDGSDYGLSADELVEEFNYYGGVGWEVVHMHFNENNTIMVYFKRKIL